MAEKKNIYIDVELRIVENQLESMKKFLIDNPYDEVVDRKEMQQTKTGGSFYTVVQTKEAIQKGIRDTLKDFQLLTDSVKKLREAEEKKKLEARGGAEISPLAEDFINRRK